MSTKITYNGKTTELADGYIATLPCKDLKMETDVVIEAPEPAESVGSSINVQPLNATANGTYDAPEGQAYDPVTVDVKPITEPITITENGVYPVPKGAGTIEEGGTYTFKSYISDEEINEWLSKTGQTEQATIFGSTLGVDGLDYDNATVNSSAFGGAEFGNHIDVVINRKIISYLTPAYIAFLRENEVDVPDDVENWANVSSDLSIVTKADPPTVTIPSPSLSTENFALSSIFFDIETKSLDGWGDITVNVAPLPIEVSTEAEMTALLESGEVGGVYKYTGTTGTYENGALYVLEAELGTFTYSQTQAWYSTPIVRKFPLGMTWGEFIGSDYNSIRTDGSGQGTVTGQFVIEGSFVKFTGVGSGTGANSITLDVYSGPALVEPAYVVADNGVYISVAPGGGGSN